MASVRSFSRQITPAVRSQRALIRPTNGPLTFQRKFQSTVPLSSTTSAPGQSKAVDAHPSTSSKDLDLPGATPPPPPQNGSGADQAWGTSYYGLSSQPFSKEAAEILQAPIPESHIEIKPDGLLYLPEIKYRRILNKAFGPGGWGLAPRAATDVGPKIVSREYALICMGRLVSVARGEQEYFDPSGVATATEGAKSNALLRCCKDLGIASELWDPTFIRDYKKRHCAEVWCEHVTTKKKKKCWRKKDAVLEYPYKETSYNS